MLVVMKRFIAVYGIVLIVLVAPVAAQAQGTTHNWSGLFAGVHAGGVWTDNDVDVSCIDPTASLGGGSNCSALIAAGALQQSFSIDTAGFIGGGQVGYNLQSGNVVYGLVVDFSAGSSLDGEQTVNINTFPTFNPTVATVTQELVWLSTVRGRIGYATGNWWVFATGGLAYGEVDTSYFRGVLPALAVTTAGSDSSVEVGWTLGGGGALAFGQVSLEVEYLYYDLGDQSFAASTQVLGTPIAAVLQPEFETQGSIVRINLNFHIN